jgi:hypothetical protein
MSEYGERKMKSLLAVALIVLFFTPWLEVGSFRVYGYKVPELPDALGDFLRIFVYQKESLISYHY